VETKTGGVTKMKNPPAWRPIVAVPIADPAARVSTKEVYIFHTYDQLCSFVQQADSHLRAASVAWAFLRSKGDRSAEEGTLAWDERIAECTARVKAAALDVDNGDGTCIDGVMLLPAAVLELCEMREQEAKKPARPASVESKEKQFLAV
jgi:hypothetical protein